MTADDVHGRFGGTEHYQLIQAALHKLVDRYYEKNSRLIVENEEITLRSELAGWGGYTGPVSAGEKELHPDIAMKNEPGEAGMETEKVILVECETRVDGLLSNKLRTVAYDLMRQRNPDRNELMIYLAFPDRHRNNVDKPDWANDLWFFDLPGG